MMYADLEYYLTQFHENSAMAEEFERLSCRASAYLDSLTGGRITENLPESVMEKVQNACCALAEELYAQEQGGEVASQSNHSVSVTYVSSGKTANQRLRSVAEMYLSGTGLLCAWV